MRTVKSILRDFASFRRDEKGQMGLTMALSATVIIAAAGAAVDYSIVSNADTKAQIIADSSALAAAIHVKNTGSKPSSKSEGLIGTYTAAELGYDYSSWVSGGANGVTVTVSYDDDLKEATVEVSGKTIPTFAQIMGHDNLDFAAKSTVKYYDIELKDPASIVLVLDNSGSMGWDDKKIEFNNDGSYYTPSDAIPRIDALETSVKNFMTTLDNLVGDQTTAAEGDRVLRTGMLAYNSNTINARTVNMKWGTLSDGQINAMTASGGTNSAPPMGTAEQWLTSEGPIHDAEHGKTPLKFAVFMTDGVNTSGGTTWTNQSGTGLWRKWVCWWGCYYSYKTQTNSPGWGWTEGLSQPTANIQTLSDCQAMKDAGVTVYTIGFALEPGYYEENYTWYGEMQYEYISSETTAIAYSFLQGCASDADTFIAAENAESLEDAFTTIGNDIVQEIIRISG